ncbi:hypothetical protein BGX31_001184 [Mortierella sp. GBA43]|nr:hypothetical protein BGX31_001184 [Mortierella sp. GBA43]
MDCTVRLWDVDTGSCIMVLIGHTKHVWRTHYSPNVNQIASCSDDGTIRLWDVTTGECKHTLTSNNEQIYRIVYTPDGHQIASGSNGGSVQLWDTKTGTCLRLDGHSDRVSRIVFSPQDGRAASASYDKTVKMWRLIDDGDVCDARLHWNTRYTGLTVTDMNIQDVRGLSQLNKNLLKQRGAVGEPTHSAREAAKRLTSMASAISKMKSPIPNVGEESPAVGLISIQEIETVEQEKDS